MLIKSAPSSALRIVVLGSSKSGKSGKFGNRTSVSLNLEALSLRLWDEVYNFEFHEIEF